MTSNFREEQPAKRLLVQDKDRLEDVELKHERVRDLLNSTGADALLLQEPSNIAWLTSGADLYRCAAEDCSTSVFVTPEARLFATNSVDSAQIFEREAFGLGFQLKQREWFQPHGELVEDLCRGRKVISDRGMPGTRMAPTHLCSLRMPLTKLESERLRLLGRVAVHAVESTAHHLRAGVTESEVAGEVSHRLLKRTVAAARIQVCADGRNERYRHWTFGEDPIENYAAISCVARRWGLHVGVTRMVCVNTVPERLWETYQKALMIHATGLFFSRHHESLSDVWKKVHRIYEKFGMENEWQLADQAGVLGYGINEAQVGPGAAYTIEAPSSVFWHPSVGPAMVGDTVLCHEKSNEQITMSPSWPQVAVRVKGREVVCPGILLLNSESPPEVTEEDETTSVNQSSSSVFCPDHPTEDDEPGQLDSVWEMEIPSSSSAWQSDDSRYSQESIAD